MQGLGVSSIALKFNSWCHYTEAKKDPKLLMTKDNVGMTPLHVAAVRGDADCCAVMLAAAEDPNALLQERDGEGRMCIHLASSHAHAECLERLLESDKNGHANATMNNGRTPLQLAALSGAPECVAVLLDHGVAGRGSTRTPLQLTRLNSPSVSKAPLTNQRLTAYITCIYQHGSAARLT